MTKVSIELSGYNQHGCVASIASEDDGSVQLAIKTTSRSAASVCKQASKKLRELADKVDALAIADEPFKCSTQDKINSMRTTQLKSDSKSS